MGGRCATSASATSTPRRWCFHVVVMLVQRFDAETTETCVGAHRRQQHLVQESICRSDAHDVEARLVRCHGERLQTPTRTRCSAAQERNATFPAKCSAGHRKVQPRPQAALRDERAPGAAHFSAAKAAVDGKKRKDVQNERRRQRTQRRELRRAAAGGQHGAGARRCLRRGARPSLPSSRPCHVSTPRRAPSGRPWQPRT